MTEQHPTDGPVHTWFSLSYCNYQVLHRTLMQSMPIEWQERMVACLEQLREAFEHLPQAEGYEVHAATVHEVGDLTDAQLAELGITETWYGGAEVPEGLDAEALKAWEDEHMGDGPTYDRAGVEMESDERVLLRCPDPVPHYNRGRTYIEPRQSA